MLIDLYLEQITVIEYITKYFPCIENDHLFVIEREICTIPAHQEILYI